MYYKFVLLFCFIFSWQNCRAQQSDTLVLLFDNAEYELKAVQFASLDSLATVIQKFTPGGIKIFGYTDQVGQLSDNKDLSLKRAKSVRGYLLGKKHKLNPKLLTEFKGFGPAKTSHTLSSGTSVAKQRRVEIIIERTGNTTDFSNLNPGENITIENMDFIPGRHVLTPEAQPSLDNLLQVMQKNSSLKIEIQGHICCQTGTDGFDQDTKKNELSANRARFIYNYLIKNGIEAGRLSYRGFGRTRPKVNPELTEEDRQKNRRVEIQIISR